LNKVSEILRLREEILSPYLVSENKLFEKRQTYQRTVNEEFFTKPIKNLAFFDLNKFMVLSDVLHLLIHSKRINILKLFNRFKDFSDPKNNDTLMAVMVNRALIERISYFYYIVRQFQNFPLPEKFEGAYPKEFREELLPKMARALYQTSLNWHFMQEANFKHDALKKYEYENPDYIDRKPLNILTPISQLSRKVKGLENSYAFLSEFVHPNIGDLESATVAAANVLNEFGDPIIQRTLSSAIPDCGGGAGILLNQSEEIILDALTFYQSVLPETDAYLKKAKSLCRDLVHSELRGNGLKKFSLRKGSKCPCLSGIRVKDCLQNK